MRKLLLFALSLILVSACTDSELNSVVESTESEVSYYRDYNSALKIAQEQIFGNGKHATRAYQPVVKDHYVYTFPRSTRSMGEGSAAFHVINFADNKGFALVSTDVRTTPVYAYSSEGNIDMNKAISETGFADFMKSANNYYLDEIRKAPPFKPWINPQDSVDKYGDVYLLADVIIEGVRYKQRTSESRQFSEILLTTKWDQCSPYNYYYQPVTSDILELDGRAAAGCGPIAISQIMAYHKKPISFNNHIYNWDLILSKPEYYLFECTDASLQTAQLIYDVSQCANAIYGIGTGISIDNAKRAFELLGYTARKIDNFSKEQVLESIDNSKPVYIRGSGHAWVIDGYEILNRTCTLYQATPPFDICSIEYDIINFYHSNWGWGNTVPPMYTLDTFQTSDGIMYNEDNKMLIVSPN